MPKLWHIYKLLFIIGLLSQVAAQSPMWRVDVRRNEPNPSTFGQHIVNNEAHIFFLQKGRVKTIDAATGKLLWTFRVGLGAQLEYGSGVLVVITNQGKIFALEPATGKVRWSHAEELAGVYTIVNKMLYIAAVEKLSAINLETGNVKWSKHVTLFSFTPFEPFTVYKKHIFIYSVGGDVTLSATTYIFDEQTGRTLGRADTRGPLAIVKGRMYFQNDWIRLDKPDDVFIDVHASRTGKRIEKRTYTIENRNLGGYSESKMRMDARAIYISGGGNLACFPLSSPKRRGKPDLIRVPEGEVRWIAGPYRGTFVLEWQKSVWVAQRQLTKPCSPVQLREDGHKLASGHVSNVTHIGNHMFIGLKNGTFFALDTETSRLVLRLELPTSIFGATRVGGNRLVVQTGDMLRAYKLPQLTSP